MEKAFKITRPVTEPKVMSYSVLQASQMLAMLNAELARVLKLQCADIAALSAAQSTLQPQTMAWQQAQQFIQFYNLLCDKFSGDAVAMRHWLRAENKILAGVPLLLIIDDGRLDDIIHFIASDQPLVFM